MGEWNLKTEEDCSSDDNSYCAPPPIDNRIVEAIHHPEYRKGSRNQYNDIALLRLEQKVEFNQFVRPICLPLDPSLWKKDYKGYKFEVAGLRTKKQLLSFI